MRYCDGFGEELRGVLPIFTRALNARSIMSNRIPDKMLDDEVPYCIWHPQTASESTYRELFRRYPDMAYHIGRACAVAGYIDLYKDLEILPDVHIAEEARESGNKDLYDHIMSQPVRFDVMNDYKRTVTAEPRSGAYLNGDTAVSPSLDLKQPLLSAQKPDYVDEDGVPQYIFNTCGFKTNTFDITEDMSISEMRRTHDSSPPVATPQLVLDLLSTPLPLDLPTMDKDLLILMAAYYGDVDRYARLRSPEPLPQEEICCVRGIYHNTMFALWWTRLEGSGVVIDDGIQNAISARMILNNVLSRMAVKRYDDPYLIWYPSIAQESTYRELYRLRPSMALQMLRACIAGKYTTLFAEVLAQVVPDSVVVREAKASFDFRDAIEQRVREAGVMPPAPYEEWKHCSRRDLEVVPNIVSHSAGIGTAFDLLYDGTQCDAGRVEVLASMPLEWKDFPDPGVQLDYTSWPPGWRTDR